MLLTLQPLTLCIIPFATPQQNQFRKRALGARRKSLQQGRVELELAADGEVEGAGGGGGFGRFGHGVDDGFGEGLVVEGRGGVDEEHAGEGVVLFEQDLCGVEGDDAAEGPACGLEVGLLARCICLFYWTFWEGGGSPPRMMGPSMVAEILTA